MCACVKAVAIKGYLRRKLNNVLKDVSPAKEKDQKGTNQSATHTHIYVDERVFKKYNRIVDIKKSKTTSRSYFQH